MTISLGATQGVEAADRGTRRPGTLKRLWRLVRRPVKGVAIVLFGGALFYFVGINVFLGTHLFRDVISADPRTILVDYTRAYSLWPGSIHAEGVVIRGSDSHVQWILHLERCDFQVSFADLAGKKFHTDHVRVDGVSFRVRRRVDQVTPETMSALPPVPGFLDPPLANVGPPDPPPTDETYRLWSIELDDVIAAHVHEVWIDTVRYSGDLDIRGQWTFRPLRWLDVGPVIIDARPLDVSFGTVEPWAVGLVGRTELTIHPYDLRTPRSVDFLDQISLRGDMSGVALVANVANRAMEGDGVEIGPAEAPFELRAEVDHGLLRPGTQVRTEPFDVRATVAGLVLEATIQGDVQVDDDSVGYADVRLGGMRLSASGLPRVRAASIAATFATRDLDLAAQAFANPVYALKVDGAESDSLAYWAGRLSLPPEVHVVSGTLTASGRLEGVLRKKNGKGHVTFGAQQLDLLAGNTGIRGNATGALRVDGSLETKHLDFSGSTVSLREVHATVKGASLDVPKLDARAAELTVGKAGVTGRVSVDAPVVEVPSLSAVGALVALPPDIAVEGGRASAKVRLDVDLARLEGDGEATVSARRLRVRIGAQRLEGDLTVALTAKQKGAVTDLSGSQMAFQSVGAPKTLDWWGRMQLGQATLSLVSGPRFRTSLRVAAKDGSPLTALVADNTALPQWLIDAVSTKGFEATGEMVATPSVVALRSVRAHAEGADAAFEFGKIRKDRKEWALLLDLGVALAGVDVADGKTQVLLFGARPWFQEKAASLEALERRSE